MGLYTVDYLYFNFDSDNEGFDREVEVLNTFIKTTTLSILWSDWLKMNFLSRVRFRQSNPLTTNLQTQKTYETFSYT